MLRDANIELQNKKDDVTKSGINQASDFHDKSFLFTDSEEEFFENILNTKNFSVIKIGTNKPFIGKMNLQLKKAIEGADCLNAKNIFVVILNSFEKIDFDFEWLDSKLKGSSNELNFIILSEVVSLNNMKIKRGLKNIKSKIISITQKEKALNEVLKEYKDVSQRLNNTNQIDYEIERNKDCIKNLEIKLNEIEARSKYYQEMLENEVKSIETVYQNNTELAIETKNKLINENKILKDKISNFITENKKMQHEQSEICSTVEKLKQDYKNKLEEYKQTNIEYYLFNENLIIFEKYLNILTERYNTLNNILTFMEDVLDKPYQLNEINAHLDEKFQMCEFYEFIKTKIN